MFKFLQIAVTTLVLSAIAQPALASEPATDNLNRAVLEKMGPVVEKDDMQPLAAEMNTIEPAAGYEAKQDIDDSLNDPQAPSYYEDEASPVDEQAADPR